MPDLGAQVLSSTVNPHSEEERFSKVALAAFPLGPSLAAFAGRAALAECRHGSPRPSHPCHRAALL